MLTAFFGDGLADFFVLRAFPGVIVGAVRSSLDE